VYILLVPSCIILRLCMILDHQGKRARQQCRFELPH
jgi:hypothetical protein